MPFKFNPFTGNLDQADAGMGTGDMLGANNLSDVADASASRDNLGLGTLATQDGTVPVKATGAELDTGTDDTKFATAKALTDSAYAKTTDITAAAVGLGNVNNTSDVNKPVSTATQTALDLKANDADVVHDTGNETIAGVKTFSSDPIIPDEAYGVGWNGSLEPPTKNAVYDKIETLGSSGIGGSTGATDNAILRADGAGGATVQSSTVVVGDTGDVTIGTGGPVIWNDGSNLAVGNASGNRGKAVYAYGYYGGSGGDLDTFALTSGGAGLTFGSGKGVDWSSTSIVTGSKDTGIARNAAGKVEVNNGSAGTLRDLLVRQHYIDQTITPAATTGNQTINKAAGTVNIAASGTSVTVTNSLVTTSSLVFAVIRTNDSTATIKNVVPSNGSFVITLGAAATAEVSIGFIVINQ